MQRVPATGADAALNLHGSGKHGYTNGSPGVTAATVLIADCLNAEQEEIANAVEKTGQILSTSRNDQLYRAMCAMQIEAALLNPTARTAGSAYAQYLISVAEGQTPGTIIAVGNVGGIQRSTDYGVTWAAIAPAASYAGEFKSVFCMSPIDWFACGTGGEIQKSIDNGATWTRATTAASYTGVFHCAIWSGSEINGFVVVGDDGEIQTTDDIDAGIFVHRTAGSSYTGDFYGGVYSDALGLYVIVGSGGEIQTSADGVTWTRRTAGSSYVGTFTCVIVGESGLLVACGIGGEIQISTNATTWTRVTHDMGSLDLNAIAYGPIGIPLGASSVPVTSQLKYAYVAVGNDGTVITSQDARAWRCCTRQRLSSKALYGVTIGYGGATMVGETATIRQSLAV